MKKLLIVTLFAALAGLSNGSLEWAVTGSTAGGLPTEYLIGDELTLELVISGDMATAVKVDLITDNGDEGFITSVSSNSVSPDSLASR